MPPASPSALKESVQPPPTANGSERPNTQSVFFKSTTDRFENVDFKNPNIRILKAKNKKSLVTAQSKLGPQSAGGPPSSMMSNDSTRAGTAIEGIVSYLNKGPQWTKQMRATDYEAFSGKKVGFDVTSPRFNSNQVFYGQSLKLDVPGPGKYEDLAITGTNSANGSRPGTFSQPRNRHLKYAVVFNTCERRFKIKGMNSYQYQPGTNMQIGPGAYISNENSMIKKSFNMSMEHAHFL